ETFRLLVESVGDYAIFQLDPAGMVVTWNMGAQRIKGYTAEEIIGQHFSKFFTLEDVRLRKPEQELQQALRIGRVEDEGWRVRKNGSRFWANVIITALRDSAGGLRGFAKVTRDLTERRRAEEETHQLKIEQARREAAEAGRRMAERARERIARLQALTEAFSAALTEERVAQTGLTEFTASMGATTAGVWLTLRDGKTIQLVASSGFSPEQKKANERVDIGTAAPISETIKTGEPVWLESRASLPLAAGGR